MEALGSAGRLQAPRGDQSLALEDGPLETVPEVGQKELDAYLTGSFQTAEVSVLRRRSIPAMTAAVAARRRNLARKGECLDKAIWLVASGIASTATYAVNLAL